MDTLNSYQPVCVVSTLHSCISQLLITCLCVDILSIFLMNIFVSYLSDVWSLPSDISSLLAVVHLWNVSSKQEIVYFWWCVLFIVKVYLYALYDIRKYDDNFQLSHLLINTTNAIFLKPVYSQINISNKNITFYSRFMTIWVEYTINTQSAVSWVMFRKGFTQSHNCDDQFLMLKERCLWFKSRELIFFVNGH